MKVSTHIGKLSTIVGCKDTIENMFARNMLIRIDISLTFVDNLSIYVDAWIHLSVNIDIVSTNIDILSTNVDIHRSVRYFSRFTSKILSKLSPNQRMPIPFRYVLLDMVHRTWRYDRLVHISYREMVSNEESTGLSRLRYRLYDFHMNLTLFTACSSWGWSAPKHPYSSELGIHSRSNLGRIAPLQLHRRKSWCVLFDGWQHHNIQRCICLLI